MYGKGVVVNIQSIHDEDVLPVKVEFGEDEEKIEYEYTFDGRYSIYGKPILHQGHIDIPEPELKEIVHFEKGEIVWCMDNCNKWHCARFEEFNPDFPQKILASHPQENSVYCAKEYHDIRKYEDRPF
ncbi:MAG TPA: hypothetical protein PK355_11245 [Chitinophagales bacterium]|nr:hypothetical protein [Chitinophagales bacterium]